MTQETAAQELARLEQRFEQFSMQKKQFQSQLAEAQAAKDALGEAKSSYKLIGNLMVERSKESLKKELEDKRQTLSVRIATIEKQEGKLKEELKERQEEALKEAKK